MKVLIFGMLLLLACAAAFAVRAVRLKRRQFDNRSDVTKLIVSAGNRRRDSKTKARFMGER